MGKPNKHGRFFKFMKSYFGQDTYGHDVKAFGDTTGKYVEWDASDDTLDVAGNVEVTGELEVNGLQFVVLTTAITANTTTTSVVSGSIGITSNATGVGSLFISDGTKWQFAVVA